MPWANYDETNYLHSTSPIIDAVVSNEFGIVPTLINGFIMNLMFFISGLFTWTSYAKKGFSGFLKKRLTRLGIPLLFMLFLVNPLAYYPAYLLTGGDSDLISFWRSFSWNSGPGWFLTMLLAFDLITAILFRIINDSFLCRIADFLSRPWYLLMSLLILSSIVYMPAMALCGPYQWLEWGILTIGQKSRLGLYMVYFITGVIVGRRSFSLAFLRNIVPLSISWLTGMFVTLLSVLFLVVSLGAIKIDQAGPWTRPFGWQLLGLSQVSYGAMLSIACLTFFTQFVYKNNQWCNNFSLNSFYIYVLHYPFVIWAQYYLLNLPLAAWIKILLAFFASVLLSWGASELLRKALVRLSSI